VREVLFLLQYPLRLTYNYPVNKTEGRASPQPDNEPFHEPKGAFGHLWKIFLAGLKRVDPHAMIVDRLSLDGGSLNVRGDGDSIRYDLDRFDRVLVVGAGKASAKMAKAIEDIMLPRISAGVVSMREPCAEHLEKIRAIEAEHPLPGQGSLKAAEEIIALAEEADERTLVIVLLSGGGSSLLVSPLRWETPSGVRALSLEEIRRTTDALLACGAPIRAVNCVRKHLSNITGGKLARVLSPATQLVLILSDVVGDRLDTIASGPACPDETTYADALEVVRGYGIENLLPDSVREALKAGAMGLIDETPKAGDAAFSKVHSVLVGTNRSALDAAEGEARRLGYLPVVLTSRITGEAREVAKVLYAIAGETLEGGSVLGAAGRPLCILAGGETTVTLRGKGKGGRNQELALSFLLEMERGPAGEKGIYLLSASTDGSDGPTDAAGAFASPEGIERARTLRHDPAVFLGNNDSYTFFEKTGFLCKTGPTGTNVCDLQIILVP
jgi:glycerate 2-kinase